MKEKISVIIPYFFGEDYIEDCLESLYSQTYNNLEIIVVNDGSPKKILEQLKTEKYPTLIIHNQENLGQSVARNKGAELSFGEFLLFLDCDDKLDPNYIEKTHQILSSNKEIRICYTKANYFEAKTGEWFLPEFNLKDFLLCNCIPITALFYKQDFEFHNGFDPNLNFFEDWDLWLSIIEKGGKPYRIEEPLFNYRIRLKDNSLSNTSLNNNIKMADNKFIIYQKHYKLYEQNGLDFNYIINCVGEKEKYKMKHYNVWYRKLIYRFFKPKKFKLIYKK